MCLLHVKTLCMNSVWTLSVCDTLWFDQSASGSARCDSGLRWHVRLDVYHIISVTHDGFSWQCIGFISELTTVCIRCTASRRRLKAHSCPIYPLIWSVSGWRCTDRTHPGLQLTRLAQIRLLLKLPKANKWWLQDWLLRVMSARCTGISLWEEMTQATALSLLWWM